MEEGSSCINRGELKLRTAPPTQRQRRSLATSLSAYCRPASVACCTCAEAVCEGQRESSKKDTPQGADYNRIMELPTKPQRLR